MVKVTILPSLMAADQLNLSNVIQDLEPYCDGFHLDVMDNHFVPNMTFGVDTINKIAQTTTKPLFIHLMVDNPEDWVNKMKLRKDDIVAFHIETTKNPKVLFNTIHSNNWIASIAINPETSLEKIYPYVQYAKSILFMSVNPGFSGQQFISEVIPKIKEFVRYKKQHRLPISVAMDGGIKTTNIKQLALLGVEIFCIGSGIFQEKDHIKALEELYKAAKR